MQGLRVVPAPTPEHLLVVPCEPVGAGNTVESLQRGYIKNTVCIGEYRSVLEGIKEYNSAIRDIVKPTEIKK